VGGRDPVDLVQPADQPGEVADHYGPGALADRLGQEVGVDGEGRLLDVDEHHLGPGGGDRLVAAT
jgi:hypothetical protein